MKITALAFLLCAGLSAGAQDLAGLKASVEAYPDSLPLHEQYINAFIKSVPGFTYDKLDSALHLLEPQYTAWMERFPRSAVTPYALGHYFISSEKPGGRPWLLKSVAIDPAFVKGWVALMEDADVGGDFKMARVYIQKAMAQDPSNPDYVFSYAHTFEDTDPAEYNRLLRAAIKRFPQNERSIGELYWMAFRTLDTAQKHALYEQLRAICIKDKSTWSGYAMSNYFDFLLPGEPAKALALAKQIVGVEPEEKKEWEERISLAQRVTDGVDLLSAGKAGEAVKILDGINVGRWSDAREGMNLLKARALDAAGNTRAAYDTLLVFIARQPSDETQSRIIAYGVKIGKSAAEVSADIRGKRDETAYEAPVFKLEDYMTHRLVSLSDYRGKVVLLTFWFPDCGPCRGEFPEFKEVLSKFKGRDVVYLGINIVLDQDPFVVPLMTSANYGFIPLRDGERWAQKAYKVGGTPSNFVIGPDGKVAYSGFMIQSDHAQRMLELMIGSLLSKS